MQQHIGYRGSDDSEDLSRNEAREVEQLVRRRRKNKGHIVYGVIAGVLCAAALYMWATVRADVAHTPDGPLSTRYAAYLAFAIVLGVAAAASTLTWLIIWNINARAAESDRIREYHEARQMRVIREAIGVFLREGDESALQMLEQTQSLFRGAEAGGTVHRFRGPVA